MHTIEMRRDMRRPFAPAIVAVANPAGPRPCEAPASTLTAIELRALVAAMVD